jgi:hypothetical protein
MARNDPEARQRNGAIPERQLDGSVTLYGVEDWTQLHDDPVLEIVQRTGSADPESTRSTTTSPTPRPTAMTTERATTHPAEGTTRPQPP